MLFENNNENFFFPIEAKQRREERAKRLDKIASKIKIGLDNLKTAKSIDPKEELFVGLFKDLVIKIDYNKYPDDIFLVNNNNKIVIKLDSIYYHFYCSPDICWFVFNAYFDMSYEEIQSFIEKMTQKYFLLKNVTALLASYLITEEMEEEIGLKLKKCYL